MWLKLPPLKISKNKLINCFKNVDEIENISENAQSLIYYSVQYEERGLGNVARS